MLGVAPAASGERSEGRRIVMYGNEGVHEGMTTPMPMDGCKGGSTWVDADVARESKQGGKKLITRTRVMMCGKAGEANAAALAGVRKARASIAANRDMPDEVRAEILKELDHTIAGMEHDAG